MFTFCLLVITRLTCFTVATSQSLEAVNAQVLQNQNDLPIAVANNQQQGTPDGVANLKAAEGMYLDLSRNRKLTDIINSPRRTRRHNQGQPNPNSSNR